MPDTATPRRRFERLAVDVPVRVSTIDPERDRRTGRPCFRATREYCANLSRGGAFIRTGDPFTPGGRVLLELHVPERAPIEAVGRVAWARSVLAPEGSGAGSGVGVEFVELDGDQRTALERWLEARRAARGASPDAEDRGPA